MGLAIQLFMGLHNRLYRWSAGKRFNMDGTLLLLTSTGAKSGKKRTNPLVHLKLEDGSFVLGASNRGADKHPAWYHNLVASPDAEVEYEEQRVKVRARVAEEPERSELYAKLEEMQPRFVGYKGKTDRVIPVVVLVPRISADRDH